MPKYVALLRGINVGGNNMIKMEALREVFSAIGFKNVRSYINSGNIAFETKKTSDAKLTKTISDAIEVQLGKKVAVMVRAAQEIDEIISNNPFVGQFENDKDLHVFFLASELSKEQQELLATIVNENEKLETRGSTLYCLLKISIVDSFVGKGFIDKKLKISATARNWRTVKKLAEL
ncbi:MAG TPA: DUF1697 domain-containing protein [Pyrinomonadaceae bacterium]|nr:DUF1697 domain-containing protein [Pyrinomonadaceae bacterium]